MPARNPSTIQRATSSMWPSAAIVAGSIMSARRARMVSIGARKVDEGAVGVNLPYLGGERDLRPPLHLRDTRAASAFAGHASGLDIYAIAFVTAVRSAAHRLCRLQGLQGARAAGRVRVQRVWPRCGKHLTRSVRRLHSRPGWRGCRGAVHIRGPGFQPPLTARKRCASVGIPSGLSALPGLAAEPVRVYSIG